MFVEVGVGVEFGGDVEEMSQGVVGVEVFYDVVVFGEGGVGVQGVGVDVGVVEGFDLVYYEGEEGGDDDCYWGFVSDWMLRYEMKIYFCG